MKNHTNTRMLIITKCNHNTGTGHLKRSLELQLCILRANLECDIWVNENNESRKTINDSKQKKNIKFYKKFPFQIQDYKIYRLIVIDIAWNDSLFETNNNSLIKLIEKLNNLNIRVVNIGKPKLNTFLFRSYVDIYPDGSSLKTSGNISPKFVTLRSEFNILKTKKFRLFKGIVFLTMGGTDPLNMMKKALEQLVISKFIKHIIIMGGNNLKLNAISINDYIKRFNKTCNFLINVETKRVINSMLKSDIVVSAFGTSAFEAMSLGVPVIAVTHYSHQHNSAKWFSDLKAIEYLGCAEKGIEWTNLLKSINYFYKYQKYAKDLSITGNSYIDGMGSNRLMLFLKEVYDETFYDLDDLFIFAHPGNEALVASGTISKLVESGKKVGIVVLGDGISSRIETYSKKNNIAKLHIDLEQAFEESCKALGVCVRYFFRYPDNQFDNEPMLSYVKNIEVILKRHNPERIWTHLDLGISLDHKIVNKAVMIASRPLAKSKISKVFGFKSPGANDWSFSKEESIEDNWYEEVDIKSKRRIKSYNAYSKINYFNHSIYDFEFINSILKIKGKKIGVTAAESFSIIRNVSRMSK